MANFNSVNKAYSAAVPSVKIPAGELKGQLMVARDEYTSLANLTASDTISTGIRLPAGARVHQIIVTSPTNGGTVDVGISGSATKYGAAFTAAATSVKYPAIKTTAEEDLILTSGGATATGKYEIVVFYNVI